jgi:integrase
MSNNRLWKRQLQNKIDAHNRQHGRKPKGVSNKTMHERAASLFRSFGLLRRLGYQIAPSSLAGRHVQVLVDYWTCNPRVADLCRQRGVAMLERAHSAAYIQQQLSFLRVYAGRWIGKPGMVYPLAAYVDEPARFKRSYAAKEDRSWEGNAVEFKGIVETVAAIDPRVAAQLALLLAFGLRRKEAVMFMPHIAVVRRENVPGTQHPSDRYAAFLRVERGTKGGRLRFVGVRNDDQRSALERALPFALHPSSHLGHPGLTLNQSLKRFDNVMRKAGVTKMQLGVTAHGLRHQFAQEFHVELTDLPAPVRGGDGCVGSETLQAALLEIARQLGHNRPQITSAYLGSPARSSPSVSPPEAEKEACS